MAHFAKIGKGNKVEQVVVVANDVLKDENNIEQETKGVEFLQNLYKSKDIWKQTSYNTRSGNHKLGGTPFRKNLASVGYTYDFTRDAFIPPKPFNSWTLNENTCQWEAPVAYPDDGEFYSWNEANQTWDLAE